MKKMFILSILFLGGCFLGAIHAQAGDQKIDLNEYENRLVLTRYWVDALKVDAGNITNQNQALLAYNALMEMINRAPVTSWKDIDEEWLAKAELAYFEVKDAKYHARTRPNFEGKLDKKWGIALMRNRFNLLMKDLDELKKNPQNVYAQRDLVMRNNQMVDILRLGKIPSESNIGKIVSSWQEVDQDRIRWWNKYVQSNKFEEDYKADEDYKSSKEPSKEDYKTPERPSKKERKLILPISKFINLEGVIISLAVAAIVGTLYHVVCH